MIDISIPAKPRRVAGNLAITADDVSVLDGHVFVASEPDGLAVLGLYGPRFEQVFLSAQGEVRLRIDGPSGATARLQRSANLKDWFDWQPVTFATDPMEVSYPDSASASP